MRLTKLVAGRQENKDGELRHRDDYSNAYWTMVGTLVGNKITIAYEVQDGHALHMRLATLTGEHNFFTRYEKLDEVSLKVQKILDSRKQSESTPEDIE